MGAEQPNLFTLPTPSMPKLDVSRCVARPINYETAANMVETYHYAHRVPSIVMSFGMYVDDVLAGCITCGLTPNPKALASICGDNYSGLELNRLFIHDWAPRNSESWFIGRLLRLMSSHHQECQFLLSYADPNAYHQGYIYQATNWLYLGQGCPESGSPNSNLIIDGEVWSGRKCGHVFGTRSIKRLHEMGIMAEYIQEEAKHRYAYFLGSKKQRKELRQALRWPVLPYPKG